MNGERVNIFFKDVTCGSHAACLANRPNESNLDRHRRIKLKLLLMGTRRKKTVCRSCLQVGEQTEESVAGVSTQNVRRAHFWTEANCNEK